MCFPPAIRRPGRLHLERMQLPVWVRIRSESRSLPTGIRWIKFLAFALVGGFAFVSLLPATKSSPIFGDEIGWISASSYTADLLRSGRFDWRFWNTDSFGSYGSLNPPIGKLALGLPMRIGNQNPPFQRLWDWSLDETGNRIRGNLPPQDLLLFARRIAALQSALLVVVACALGWEVGGPTTGLLAAGLLCLLPTWRGTGSLVLTDMLSCAIVLSMAFPAIRLLRRPDGDRGRGPMITLGLLLGLAGGVKPTGFVLGGLFLSVILAYRVLRSRRILRQLPWTIGALAIAAATMVALGPWLWPASGAAGSGEILREVPVALAAVCSRYPIESLRVHRDQREAMRSLGRPALILLRARRWKSLVAFQRTLPQLQWEGPRMLVLLDWMLFRLVVFPAEPLFVLVGIWGLARTVRPQEIGGSPRPGPGLVPVLFSAAAFVYVMFLVILPVERYLLPLLALFQILAADGILYCFRSAFERLHRLKDSP